MVLVFNLPTLVVFDINYGNLFKVPGEAIAQVDDEDSIVKDLKTRSKKPRSNKRRKSKSHELSASIMSFQNFSFSIISANRAICEDGMAKCANSSLSPTCETGAIKFCTSNNNDSDPLCINSAIGKISIARCGNVNPSEIPVCTDGRASCINGAFKCDDENDIKLCSSTSNSSEPLCLNGTGRIRSGFCLGTNSSSSEITVSISSLSSSGSNSSSSSGSNQNCLLEQWAISATASTSYPSTDYSVNNIIGPSDCVCSSCAGTGPCWCPGKQWVPTGTANNEYVEVTFQNPTQADKITIYESANLRAVKKVTLFDTSNNQYVVFNGQADGSNCNDKKLVISFNKTSVQINKARIETQHVSYEGIDAIKLECSGTTTTSSSSSSSSSGNICIPPSCPTPPTGCSYINPVYQNNCLVNCGTLSCPQPSSSSSSSGSMASSSSSSSSGSICIPPSCPAPPTGCSYINPTYQNNCLVNCGTLYCPQPSSSSSSSGGTTSSCSNPPSNESTPPGACSTTDTKFRTAFGGCQDLRNCLVWSTKAPSWGGWDTGRTYCENLVEGNADNWRVPTLTELQSVAGNNGASGHFNFNTGVSYWSNSEDGSNTNNAQAINLSTGIQSSFSKYAGWGIVCVRNVQSLSRSSSSSGGIISGSSSSSGSMISSSSSSSSSGSMASSSSSSSSGSTCNPLSCPAPPTGCSYINPVYQNNCLVNCGTLSCPQPSSSSSSSGSMASSSSSSSSGSICNPISCPAPQGCSYINPVYQNNCLVNCGTLYCPQPSSSSSSSGGIISSSSSSSGTFICSGNSITPKYTFMSYSNTTAYDSISRRAYIFGGVTYETSKQILEYNPSTNSIQAKLAILPIGRSAAKAVLYQDQNMSKIYILGGRDGTSGGTSYSSNGPYSNQILAYDPSTDMIAVDSNLPIPLTEFAVAYSPLTRSIYTFGGVTQNPSTSITNAIYKYDPSSMTTTQVNSLATPRNALSAVWCPLTNRIYVIGGVTSQNNIIEFNPLDNSISLKSTMVALVDKGIVWNPICNRIIIYTASSTGSQILEYDPVLDKLYTRSEQIPASALSYSPLWAENKGYIFGANDILEHNACNCTLQEIPNIFPNTSSSSSGSVFSCTDTDGGNNISVKGTLNATLANGQVINISDFCYTVSPDSHHVDCSGDNCYSQEYFCSQNTPGYQELQIYKCSSCMDGVCIVASPGSSSSSGALCSPSVTYRTEALPSGRRFTSAIWNSNTNKAYIFGGEGLYTDTTSQILEYDPANPIVTNRVTIRPEALPSSRTRFSTIYNPTTNKAYIFGGLIQSSYSNQIIEYDLSTFMISTRSETLPSGRGDTLAILNSNTGKIYILGGLNNTSTPLYEIIEYDPTNPTISNRVTIRPETLASPYRYTSAVFNPATNKAHIFGEVAGGGEQVIAEYDLSMFTITTRFEAHPRTIGAVWNRAINRAYVFGGYEQGFEYDRIFEYDPSTSAFSLRSETLPQKILGISSVWNTSTNKAYLFGGQVGGLYTPQILEFNPCATQMSSSSSSSSSSGLPSSCTPDVLRSIIGYSIPTPNSVISDITTGPDGNLWFTESTGNKIRRITPNGTITEYPIPTPNSKPLIITTGSDGNLWFTESDGRKIGKITPNGTITEYPLPTTDGGVPFYITAGSDGNLWFTETNNINMSKIGRITTNGVITEFLSTNYRYSEIITGPDRNLWVIAEELTSNTAYPFAGLFAIDTNGTITRTIQTCGVIGQPCKTPRGLVIGPNGNLSFSGGQISSKGTADLENGTLANISTLGPNGQIWSILVQNGGYILPYVYPSASTEKPIDSSSRITTGPDHNFWYTSIRENKIYKASFCGFSNPGHSYIGTSYIDYSSNNDIYNNNENWNCCSNSNCQQFNYNRRFDFNKDGILDIVESGGGHYLAGSSTLSICLGNEVGGCKSKRLAFPYIDSELVLFKDFNNDGNLDYATIADFVGISAQQDSKTIWVFKGKGDGTFVPWSQFQITDIASFKPRKLQSNDFNRDGKLDIAISLDDPIYHNDTIKIFSGNGNGTFSNLSAVQTGKKIISFDTGDFNGDSNPDLAVLNLVNPTFNDNAITIYYGNGTGNFLTNVRATSQTDSPSNIFIGDYNNDSKSDIRFTDRSAGNTSIKLGQSNNTFTPVYNCRVSSSSSSSGGTQSCIPEQWASGNVTASTYYNGYESSKALGVPDCTQCRAEGGCYWCPSTNGVNPENLTVSFGQQSRANGIEITEIWQPGGIRSIILYDANNTVIRTLTSPTDFTDATSCTTSSSNVLKINFPLTNIPVTKVRINTAITGFEGIDAVKLICKP